jgi:DNA-binding PadR family transcriptional regulator
MPAAPVRVTLVVLDILAAIDLATPDDPAWGFRLGEQIGHGAGTAYPALHRLEEAGWITSRPEEKQPDRPRRRFYQLTDDGRAAYYRELDRRGWRALLPRELGEDENGVVHHIRDPEGDEAAHG